MKVILVKNLDSRTGTEIDVSELDKSSRYDVIYRSYVGRIARAHNTTPKQIVERLGGLENLGRFYVSKSEENGDRK